MVNLLKSFVYALLEPLTETGARIRLTYPLNLDGVTNAREGLYRQTGRMVMPVLAAYG